jgi:hypothetical protein
MTAQTPDSILINGELHLLETLPLETYVDLGGRLPKFDYMNSACWRGYLGTWEIHEDRLYLVKIEAPVVFDEGDQYVTLGDLFPGFPERVFAHWYSGTLQIPQGDQIESDHDNFESVFERDLLIEIQNGVVMKTTIKHNGG